MMAEAYTDYEDYLTHQLQDAEFAALAMGGAML